MAIRGTSMAEHGVAGWLRAGYKATSPRAGHPGRRSRSRGYGRGRSGPVWAAHDAGLEVYSQPLAIRADDLETLTPCLEKLVPAIQQSTGKS